jgi:hypothetical protein
MLINVYPDKSVVAGSTPFAGTILLGVLSGSVAGFGRSVSDGLSKVNVVVG